MPHGEEPTLWFPSESLRRWLGVGLLAAFLALGLNAASVAIEFARAAEPEGFSSTDLLEMLLVLPELALLVAFLLTAREVRSIGLWRSAIGYYGSSWLMLPLIVFSHLEFAGSDAALGVILVVGALLVLWIVSIRPEVFDEPASVAGPTVGASEPLDRRSSDALDQAEWARPKEAGDPETGYSDAEDREAGDGQSESAASTPPARKGWGCGTVFLILIALRVLTRMARNWNNVDLPTVAVIVGVAAFMCSLLAYVIWFAVAKIRLRDKLGPMATVSGVVDLLSLVAILALAGFTAWTMWQAELDGVELDDRDPRLVLASSSMSLLDVVTVFFLGLLLLTLWRREPDPWGNERYTL